jgi:hypothetical protein
MATLVFSAVGTLAGGPLGGAIGALVGRQVDAAILGGGNRQGPRLKELAATTSSYGDPLPRHFGRMRVAGSIIWATELVEHSETQGGGKNRPSVTSFNYTASFAVALASRPIRGIGRIWADGNLLRGAGGDLKTGGILRIHTGHGDQEADPLIAELEGAERCPAWRGLAYVVFEDLELGDFFNRIPALTFEVIADDTDFSLNDIAGELIDEADMAVALPGIAGLSNEGPLLDTLQLLDPIFPMSADAGGDALVIARERLQDTPVVMPEAAISVDDGDFGGASGFTRKRSPATQRPPAALRYYDIERDYLPGVQRVRGQAGSGQPETLELPAAMTASEAQRLVQRAATQADWARERIAWRSAELDSSIAPGAIVRLTGQTGRWRVEDWEWRASGVELTLSRVVPMGAEPSAATPVDPGRINPPPDLAPPPTALLAFELPWDGNGSGDTPTPFAAASSTQASWSGAALFADHGDGELLPLGPSGKVRSIVGTATSALAAASPLLIDRESSVIIDLLGQDMALVDATGRQLSAGANRALLGEEIIQFAKATPLGGSQWRLATLLRGRGGTEAATAEHVEGEAFVLLDSRPIALDPAIVGVAPDTMIVATGRGDAQPILSAIALRGISRRPLSPVHPRVHALGDGGLRLGWTRRARGAWLWNDGVDVPPHEQAELYQVTFGPLLSPRAVWSVAAPTLTLSAETVADLSATLPGGAIHVRQQGNYALSEPLFLLSLA